MDAEILKIQFKINIKQVLVLLMLFVSIPLIADKHLFGHAEDSIYTSIEGIIVDKESGDKLSFAKIAVVSTNIATVTNSEGVFLLKIPLSLVNTNIEISYIGYETKLIPLKGIKPKNNKISLNQISVALPVVNVLPTDSKEIVYKMLQERRTNYSDNDMIMRAFYRETIRKKTTPVSISEAIVDVYKQSYNDGQQDKISIFKSRKSSDYNKLDTLVFKLMGGPFNAAYIDVIKYPEYFINTSNINDYTFQYMYNDKIDNRLLYVVSFRQIETISEPLPQGKLYIDAQTYGLFRAEFEINLMQPEVAAMLFIRKKPFNARVFATKAQYLIDYKLVNDKWRYTYSRIDLGLKIDWKKKLFNTYYNSTIEMAATNWDEKPDKNAFKEKNLIRPNVVLYDAISGFYDKDFWGQNNIIEPEKSIENAIYKIQKKLTKTDK